MLLGENTYIILTAVCKKKQTKTTHPRDVGLLAAYKATQNLDLVKGNIQCVFN